jgi:hypothetical protein
MTTQFRTGSAGITNNEVRSMRASSVVRNGLVILHVTLTTHQKRVEKFFHRDPSSRPQTQGKIGWS